MSSTHTEPHIVAHPDSNESAKDAAENSSDVEQHCLLFPTYATRHSRSGSKDPLDWNIRVRGWAFSKRSNRRKRLVMSMARKLAGVTKDNKVYETLESRFGMFLASNTQGARFSIQCVGLAKTTHMELAGDPNFPDETVDVLLSELKAPDAALAAAEAAQDKARLRKSLEEDEGEFSREPVQGQDNHHDRVLDNGSRYQRPQKFTASDSSSYSPADGAPLSRYTSPEAQEGSFSDRWTKGAALVKGAYRKYKPMVMAQVASNGSSTSVGSRRVPSSNPTQSRSSPGASTDHSGDESSKPAAPGSASRTDSGDSILPQTPTHYDDLGHGSFPTVQISSRPGGHFDGTLRVSHEEVQAHRRRNKKIDGQRNGGHPRFLKLHAYHPEMADHPQGIVNLIDPEGISVISDIDDTIKDTNVTAGARIILRNTFLKDMQDVPGMADVYKRWWKHGAAIHYVSNSPWQLIPSLLDFFHLHRFPPGSAHLRLHDSVLKTYFMTPGEHKRRSIREILTDFPERKFILVGDSGEIDMEIYTELAMAFPDQIFKIFIRDISTARLQEIVSKAAAAPPPNSRSFTSMIPKAPMNAVTTGFGFFSRQSDGSTPSNTDDSGHPFPRNDHTGAERAAATPGHEDTASINSSTFEGFDHAPEDLQPPKLGRRRSQTVSSLGSTPCTTPGQTPPRRPSPSATPFSTNGRDSEFDSISSSTTALTSAAARSAAATTTTTTTDVAALDDEPMPGAPPPTEPTVVKNPLEVWMERVELCRKKLPEGTLTFFEDASTLEECPLVSEMIRHYRGLSTWDDEDEEDEENKDDKHHHHSLHVDKLIDV